MRTFYVIGCSSNEHAKPEAASHHGEAAHVPAKSPSEHHEEAGACHFDYLKASSVVKSPRWTVQQIEDATQTMSFPKGTTAWDKFVAFNSFYDELRSVYSEEDILKGAYKYFFADKDAPECKIWHYMKAMKKL